MRKKSEDQEKVVSSILGPLAVADEKKCGDLAEEVSSDLGLADFDFDVPDQVLANIEMPTSAPVSNFNNNLSYSVFNNRLFPF